jgi:hypothetical protein
MPVIASIENPGASLQATVRVEVTWGSDLRGTLKRRIFVRDLLLAGGATRRIPLTVPFPRDARALVLTVSTQEEELTRDEVDLRSVVTTDRVIAAISSELSLDALSGLSANGDALRVVYPRVDDLPEAWAGYDGVDMVIVHDTYFQQLRPSQAGALENWVATGGTLVFTGGAAALQHAASGLGRLLPVQVEGLVERDGLPSLLPLVGVGSGAPRGKIVLARSTLVAGTVIAAQDGVPIVVESRRGRGAVWFVAMDPTLPPFPSWPGLLPLWRTMMERDRQPAQGSVVRDPADDPWMKALLDSPPLAFPSIPAVLAFAGGYTALVLLLGLGRASRRIGPRMRAALFVTLPAVGCMMAWVLFSRVLIRPEALLLDASRAEVISGSGLALVTEKLGIFASRAGAGELTVGGASPVIDEVPPLAGTGREARLAGGDLVVAGTEPAVIRGLSYGRFGSRLLVIQDVIPLPISATVAGTAAAPRVTVSNSSPRALRRSFLALAGVGYLIGDVPPGATVHRSFVPADGVDLRDAASRLRLAGSAARRELWDEAGDHATTGPGVVAAWLDGPVLPVSARGATRPVDRPALSLVLVEAP